MPGTTAGAAIGNPSAIVAGIYDPGSIGTGVAGWTDTGVVGFEAMRVGIIGSLFSTLRGG